MADENLDLKALVTEATASAVANVVAPMQAEIKALKKQITPEALTDAEMTAMVKEWRSSFITTGRIAPETAEEKRLWREAHGTPYDGNLLTR